MPIPTKVPVNCPTCGNALEATIESEDVIDVPDGHLGCGPFSEITMETMRASVREALELDASRAFTLPPIAAQLQMARGAR